MIEIVFDTFPFKEAKARQDYDKPIIVRYIEIRYWIG